MIDHTVTRRLDASARACLDLGDTEGAAWYTAKAAELRKVEREDRRRVANSQRRYR